uniref:amino acid ABC transporter ATP-binding protein n=1 Tax=Pararhizobium sp. IMCC3301 TaxID=3067904 RepID=UPI0027426C86|nr:amino acid ABC transporter ATP-binding protein [Pararhizobium sp. IMCC3301]
MQVVKVENICKRFGKLEVLKGVSLAVGTGEVVALMGRSGGGKSTLLRCLNGLETIDSGSIEIAGHQMSHEPKKLRALRHDVGIVFQSYNLFPHLTAGENIMLAPRRVAGLSKQAAEKDARAAIALVGLDNKWTAYPDQLSGGQQQRIAIARSLVMKPKVMLFDEVTSALDPELTTEVLNVLEKLARNGMTMILATHEMSFARRVANSVVFMHNGRIHEQAASDQFFSHPETAELKTFLQSDSH